MTAPLFLRNVEVDGRAGLDVRVEAGRIVAIGARLEGKGWDFDGQGGALLPGLADHHLHLLSLAAREASVDLTPVRDAAGLAERLKERARTTTPGAWMRAIGYHERMAGDLQRGDLDRLVPRHRLRIQHQTGSLWMLNSLAVESLGSDDLPSSVERDDAGRPTGRIWRGDAWLRARLRGEPPALEPIGRRFAACGVTHLTDASVTTDGAAADMLANAHRRGALPQKLTLMSGGPLGPPEDGAYRVGPVKILLDEHTLPDLDDFIAKITLARLWRRNVAVHCVTATELALTLAAFQATGGRPGDRVEHGGVIPQSAIPPLRDLRLTVVTQPAFVRERGDRYLADVEAHEQGDLYRCRTLMTAGVPTAASSDAPYASADPWIGVRAAMERRTLGGRTLGLEERLAAETALGLYLGKPISPGSIRRRVRPGADADLCLLRSSFKRSIDCLDADGVAATFIDGAPVYIRG